MSLDLCENNLNGKKKVPYVTLHAAFMTRNVNNFIPDDALKLGFLLTVEG